MEHMNEKLSPEQLIAVARCLSHFQSDITDYELTHYAALHNSERAQIEKTLALLAATSGRLYAFSVQLEFDRVLPAIKKMQEAATELSRFLQAVQKIQRVLDAVTAVASLADSIMNHDVESIASGIDNMIRIISKA
jgi:hypothetical protein